MGNRTPARQRNQDFSAVQPGGIGANGRRLKGEVYNVQEMMTFNLDEYGSTIATILGPAEGGTRLMPLAPDGPWRHEGWERLRKCSTEALFDQTPVTEEFASCVESALYLYFSDLDRSHTISQNIGSATGSFLHGIMHRQEPDFGNAKYWFRKVAGHPVFGSLREAALEMLSEEDAAGLRGAIEGRDEWDVFWMVDQCEAARRGGGGELEKGLLGIQLVEWQLVFDYCYRRAVGVE